jgi:polar amino acid transport system substrate-binding protein
VAHHAEIIRVPQNLMTLIPAGVEFEEAAPWHSARSRCRESARPANTGETFVVIGLGVLGQLTAQLLRANGCTVIGVDLDASGYALAATWACRRA